MDQGLARLCRAFGILTTWRDTDGKRRVLGPEPAVVLLGAMGVQADSPSSVREALQGLHARRWRAPLEPVQVVRAGEPIEIPLCWPNARARAAVAWVLEEENGALHEGNLKPAGLPVAGTGRVGARRYARYRFRLQVEPAPGYHRLRIEPGEDWAGSETRLIVVPPACYRPEAIDNGGRVWGPGAVLPALRSSRNWGIGDFTDLTRLTEFWAGVGAGLVDIGPLHAPRCDDAERADAQAPSSRLFLNALHLDVETIPDLAACPAAIELVRSPAFQAQLRALRTAERIPYADVADAKRQVLDLVYRDFRGQHLEGATERGNAFRAYQAAGGQALWRQSVFEALAEHLRHEAPTAQDWLDWPTAYRDPSAPEVTAFAAAHREQVELFQYLQWQAEQQLAGVGRRSWELGLGVGLCCELALGSEAGGAEVWGSPGLYALGARIGTPPDAQNPNGEVWPIAPPIPARRREAGYAPWARVLGRNMQSAGALRVDRVHALRALLWVPPGGAPNDGAWVRYPLGDLLGVLALESHRNRCLVIGEDLGPIPRRVGAALTDAGILSYRLLCLERDANGDVPPPAQLPPQCLITCTAPPLLPLAAYWQGRDLDLGARFGLFATERSRGDQVVARAQDQARLLVALEREGLLPVGITAHPVSVPEMTPELVRALHQYIGRSPASLVTLRLEDLIGLTDESVPTPGATPGDTVQPPWRQRLALELERWGDDPRVTGMAEAMRLERGDSARPHSASELAAEAGPDGAKGASVPDAIIPRATYRLQLHRGFTFDDALERVPYLAALGVSHCYLSPILRARPGSNHGYDIIDHGTINPDLGGEAGFERLVAALQAHGMGVVLDLVPNHMGIMGSVNIWWLDVLENGPAAAAASYFDIDWLPVKDELRAKVLLPTLGDHYGNILDRGELRLAFDPELGAFSLFYYEHRFPVDPREYPLILAPGIGRLEARLGSEATPLLELASLITAFGYLPARTETDPERRVERQRDAALYKQHLARLCQESADVSWYIGECLREYNGAEGYPANPERLHLLIEAQGYRPASWRVAADEINYRRFFDINDLASLRMEQGEVFEASHRLVLDLVRRGLVEGLRIDHPDGLFDPREYFSRLQAAVLRTKADGPGPPAADDSDARRPVWLVAEKILAPQERLREDWAVHGTTGYDFITQCGNLLVDARAGTALERIYEAHLGDPVDADELIYQSKKLIMKSALASELNVLANQLSRIAESDRHTRDYTLNSLRSALAEVVAGFPVYRTYVTANGVSPEDARHVERALAAAKQRSPAADISVFDFVRDVLLLKLGEGKGAEYRRQVTACALKFQQYSAPVAAKGMEDTGFYRYLRLTSLNEVGGDPRRFGASISAFHRANQERVRRWPHAMLASSTHDTKRAEDVRARIHALSELPEEWRRHVQRWRRVNRGKRSLVETEYAPSRNDEYLLYQTLLGAWPLGTLDAAALDAFRERISAYMAKAIREAKVRSSWINPQPAYEAAVDGFIAAIFVRPETNPFLTDFLPFQRRVARLGMLNSLTQTLLKFTVPGVPDLYQGSELWDLSLVDPDNRCPVDWEARGQALDALEGLGDRAEPPTAARVRELLEQPDDGGIKLHVIRQCLALRRDQPDLFAHGAYRALAVRGQRDQHAVAFARTQGTTTLVVIAGRLYAALTEGGIQWPLGEVWEDTIVELPGTRTELRNALTGERMETTERDGQSAIALRELFTTLPLAVLIAA